MNSVNMNIVLTAVGYIVVLCITLLAGYLNILPGLIVQSTFTLIIGTFLGLLIPSPVKTTGNRLPDTMRG